MFKWFGSIGKSLHYYNRTIIKGLPKYVEMIVWAVVGLYFVLFFSLAITYFVMWLKNMDVKRLTELRLFVDMFSSPSKSVFMTGLLALLVDANRDGVPDPLEKISTAGNNVMSIPNVPMEGDV